MHTPSNMRTVEDCELSGVELPKTLRAVFERSDEMRKLMQNAHRTPPLFRQGDRADHRRFEGMVRSKSGLSAQCIALARTAHYRATRQSAGAAECGGLK